MSIPRKTVIISKKHARFEIHKDGLESCTVNYGVSGRKVWCILPEHVPEDVVIAIRECTESKIQDYVMKQVGGWMGTVGEGEGVMFRSNH